MSSKHIKVCHAGLDPASSSLWFPVGAGMTEKSLSKDLKQRIEG
jgi:hypothetical protein